MLQEAHDFAANPQLARDPLRLGVTTGLRPLPAWKAEADFLFVQVTYSVTTLLEWRNTVDFGGPVYAGVMVPTSAAMARKLSIELPELAVPEDLVTALEGDRLAGVDHACRMIDEIAASASFAGVHLIPVARYREIAGRLEQRV